jgi:hypothetical protein
MSMAFPKWCTVRGLVVLASLGACSSPEDPLVAMLPGDGEVEHWTRVAAPSVMHSDTQLYNQIDGDAPKYIDHGWVGSSYSTYSQNGTTLYVAIHDMGTAENAESIFNDYLPTSRASIEGRANTAINMGLPTAYLSTAFLSHYYVEVMIDDRSDSALASIEAFTLRVLDRGARFQ